MPSALAALRCGQHCTPPPTSVSSSSTSPFADPSNLRATYEFGSSLTSEWKQRDACWRAAIHAQPPQQLSVPTNCSALGIHHALAADAPTLPNLIALLSSPDACPATRAVIEADLLARHELRQSASRGDDGMLALLERDGVARFNSTLAASLAALLFERSTNGQSLRDIIASSLDSAPSRHGVTSLSTTRSGAGWSSSAQRIQAVHALKPMMQQLLPTLQRVATGYLGPESTSGGLVLLRLAARNLTKRDYGSGIWHHDRCGRRLKCFVYTTRVTAKAHPPRVIRGTHTTLYYNYDSYFASRFRDSYVRSAYAQDEAALLGDVGDGFCFDTNAIHQGTLSGSRHRDSLIFE